MTTKLEAVVGYLAGREGDANLVDELADPTSEASRFLQATRDRSRALFDEPTARVEPSMPRSQPSRWFARIAWATSAVLVLVGVVWIGELRVRRLEAHLDQAETEARARDEALQEALMRLAEAKDVSQLESSMIRLEQQLLVVATRPDPPVPDLSPSLNEVRDHLAMLRREFAASEKTSLRRVDELETAIHEVARVLRLLRSHLQPDAPVKDPLPRR